MSTTSFDLSGKAAIVTGGNGGIGLGIARGLAQAGANIVVAARNQQKTDSALEELRGLGVIAIGVPTEVTDEGDVANMVRATMDEFGRVDILVNNAGITRDNIFIRMKEGEWDEVLTVNLKGAFNMTKAVARSMMKRRSGVILNVTSVVGLVGNAGQANYAASKAGLIGFTKSIAKELASRGVRCNAIAPGFISTDMTATLPEEAVEALQEQIPLGYFGDPGDVAGLARFLAGPAGRYITGQVIAVDGGMAM